MGGEKGAPALRAPCCRGSPPRGRGKGRRSHRRSQGPGITPAWAGKSDRQNIVDLVQRDHPRVGGEKWALQDEQSWPYGSPPRGRGKEEDHHQRPGGGRITPAWAGKSRSLNWTSSTAWDHPRVGGEKILPRKRGDTKKGSPPRGRGKDQRQAQNSTGGGITPAWAGKRLKRSHRSGIFISGPIPFHSVLHRPAGSGGSRAGRDGSPAGQPQNAGPA